MSAKDLIPNHLTMSLYNHVEIWKDRPEMWPKGIYCNGHIMVDAEKMVSEGLYVYVCTGEGVGGKEREGRGRVSMYVFVRVYICASVVKCESVYLCVCVCVMDMALLRSGIPCKWRYIERRMYMYVEELIGVTLF